MTNYIDLLLFIIRIISRNNSRLTKKKGEENLCMVSNVNYAKLSILFILAPIHDSIINKNDYNICYHRRYGKLKNIFQWLVNNDLINHFNTSKYNNTNSNILILYSKVDVIQLNWANIAWQPIWINGVNNYAC